MALLTQKELNTAEVLTIIIWFRTTLPPLEIDNV